MVDCVGSTRSSQLNAPLPWSTPWVTTPVVPWMTAPVSGSGAVMNRRRRRKSKTVFLLLSAIGRHVAGSPHFVLSMEHCPHEAQLESGPFGHELSDGSQLG